MNDDPIYQAGIAAGRDLIAGDVPRDRLDVSVLIEASLEQGLDLTTPYDTRLFASGVVAAYNEADTAALLEAAAATVPTPAPAEFAAFGHPVPGSRKAAALEALRSMVPDISTEDATELIDRVSVYIERDRPYEAMAVASGQTWPSHGDQPPKPAPCTVRLDVTGTYRLLAHLCTD